VSGSRGSPRGPPGGEQSDRGENPYGGASRVAWGGGESTDGPTSYSRGWGDGVRDALNFVSRLVVRGHTPQEIRVFLDSRLAHLDEEVSLKRKTLLSSPTGIPVESLVRVQPRGAAAPSSFPPAVPGYSYLFLEETRSVARAYVKGLLPHVGRALALTRLPSEVRRIAPPQELVMLHLGTETSTEDGVEPAESSPTQLTGKVELFLTRTPAPALVYLEAFEYLITTNNLELATRFCYFIHTRAQTHRAIFVASVDPEAVPAEGVATLRRDFNHVVRAA
jgi:hypothetical protein